LSDVIIMKTVNCKCGQLVILKRHLIVSGLRIRLVLKGTCACGNEVEEVKSDSIRPKTFMG
jgi:hypothetical protein